MKKRLIKNLAVFGTATILMLPFAGCNTGKNLTAGSTWEVTEITTLKNLTIADGAVIKAPEGKSITMTVDGVETGIATGTYKGKIVLTPTTNIPVDSYNFRTAVYIENGKYVADKSVAAAVAAGTVTDTSAKDVKITSVGEKFNGIIVTGDSKSTYSIVNSVINFTGNGANDFVGYGAGIMTAGKAEVTIDNAKIKNTGAVRTAIWVGGDSVATVNNSDIEVYNGKLPEGYTFSVSPGKMMEVPWMLGVTGNLRATNLTGNGTAYYNNTHIKAQGWGAISSDNVSNTPKIVATNCTIDVTESGYGAFSLGTNVGTFSKCTFNVKDYGIISQDGDGVFTDGTVVNSDRFGAMYWGSGAYLTIDKESVFNTKSTAIQVKGGSTTITVDNAKLNPANGIILQLMANDDPNQMGGGGGGGMPGGGQGGAPGDQGGAPSGDKSGAPAAGGMPGGQGGAAGGQAGAPGAGGGQGGAAGGQGGAPAGDKGGAPAAGGMPGGQGGQGGAAGGQGGAPGAGGGQGGAASSKDVNATFSNMTLSGDIFNANTASAPLAVTFKNATITGAISTATIEHALGPNGEKIDMNHPELYTLIGEVTNTLCETKDKFGVTVSLDEKSSWVVNKTSFVTGLTIADGASVKAPEGYSITMTVNGVKKPIKAGAYKGKIVLTVTKS